MLSSSIVNGSTISGNTKWLVTASGISGIASVEFLVDNQLKWTEHYAPYQFNGDPDGILHTPDYSNGTHTLIAIAKNSSGNVLGSVTATVTISNIVVSPPPVPTGGRILGATETVASHPDSFKQTVEYPGMKAVGGNAPRLSASTTHRDIAYNLGFRKLFVIFGNFRSYPDVGALANQIISYTKVHPDLTVYAEPGNELNFAMKVDDVGRLHKQLLPLLKAANLPNLVPVLSSIGNGPSSLEHLLPLDWSYRLAPYCAGWMPNFHAYGYDPDAYDRWMHIWTPDASGRTCIKAFGNVPWVLSEFGLSSDNTTTGNTNQAHSVSAYMARIKSLASCVGGHVYAQMDDAPGSGTHYGLEYLNQVHKPSWDAYYTQAHALARIDPFAKVVLPGPGDWIGPEPQHDGARLHHMLEELV